ncbi:MAG: YicC family protein [Clostridiales bacterium]|nr:YicC family protein [Clostridiales bacterium]
MISSMTGYGRAQEVIGNKDITVEIKGINHRFFEFIARVPRTYGYIEERIKSVLQSSISRGKVEVSVAIYNVDTPDSEVAVNVELAKNYLETLRASAAELNIADDLKLSHLLQLNDVFTIRKKADDEEAVLSAVEEVTGKAVNSFVAMRRTEGSKLKEDLLSRIVSIENAVGVIEEKASQMADDYRERLFQKLTEILHDKNIDEQRVLTEAAIFAEKVAVDEETVRLRSHISQFRQLLEIPEPVGRKLDFLIQEFNRETNTIGSKVQNVEITKIVVDIKSDIEKIREQIQNIE